MKPRIPNTITEQLMLLGRLPPQSAARRIAPLRRNFFTNATTRTLPAPSRPAQSLLQRSTHRFRAVRFRSDKVKPNDVNPTPNLGSPEPAPSLSQRLKQLSREYGWTAVGVYLALSALDFPFCFLAVRLLGTDRIGQYEQVVKDAFWSAVRLAFPNAGPTPHARGEVVTGEAVLSGEGGADADALQAASRADACKSSISYNPPGLC